MGEDGKNIKQLLTASITEFCESWLSNGYVEKTGRGRVWRCGDVYNSPPSPNDGSFHLVMDGEKSGEWYDFATATGGHLLDVIMLQRNCTAKDAFKIAQEWLGQPTVNKDRPAVKVDTTKFKKNPPLKAIQPVPPHAEKYPTGLKYIRSGKDYGAPDIYYEWRDRDNKLHYVTCRYSNGAIKGLQLSYTEDWRGNCKWFWAAPAVPILYRLNKFNAERHKITVIVEGEKCADALGDLLHETEYFVTTWKGGASAVNKVDLSALTGADIIIWPDNDGPGIKAASDLKARLDSIASNCVVIPLPSDKPMGWDAADAIQEGMDKTTAIAMLRSGESQTDEAKITEIPTSNIPNTNGWPFICLGCDQQNTYFYMNSESGKIISAPISKHTGTFLLELADGNMFWKKMFPTPKGGIDTAEAVNCLMRIQHSITKRKGIISAETIRGRGVHNDLDQVLLHLGTGIATKNKTYDMIDFYSQTDSVNTYKLKPKISNPFIHQPHDLSEVKRIIEVSKSLSWQSGTSAYLAAGWLSIAPLAGILDWRPHIWVTGSRGTGKSHILKHFFKAVLGDWCFDKQGHNTEASIRRLIDGDSLPFLFDEAEESTGGMADNQKKILNLIRCASSNNSSGIMVTSRSGGVDVFVLKTCFALFSISPYRMEDADRSRICVLELEPNNDRNKYQQIINKWTPLQQEDWSARFIARQLDKLPEIKKSISMFNLVMSEIFEGNSRNGDQYGALMGGAWMIEHDKAPSYEQAVEVAKALDWLEQQEQSHEADSDSILHTILTTQIFDPIKKTQRTVAELWERAGNVDSYEESKLLKTFGFKREKNTLCISRYHNFVQKILSSYGSNWSRTLSRHRFYDKKISSKVHAFSGMSHRCVAIDMTHIASREDLVYYDTTYDKKEPIFPEDVQWPN